jgi:hypothetical protein
MTNARVLAGADLGTNGDFGGTGADADTFTARTLGVVKVAGSITGSIVSAGINPNDGTLGNGNDTVLPGSSARVITARGGADPTSRFAAASFGRVRLPRPIKDLSEDNRFQTT